LKKPDIDIKNKPIISERKLKKNMSSKIPTPEVKRASSKNKSNVI